MLRSFRLFHSLLFFQVLVALIGCSGRSVMNSPEGYDLNKPEVYTIPADLAEISGIAFKQNQSNSIYAVEDENGRVYHLKPGTKEPVYVKFGKKGDYEDIAICKRYVVILRSDGALITFPVNELEKENADHVQQFEGLLPEGEFEGLYADEKSGMLYVLCKNCGSGKQNKTCSGFILQLDTDGTVADSGEFMINVKDIEVPIKEKKITFHPSAFTKHPFTQDWYIISSVNKILVITDGNWKVKNVYRLNPSLFNQPEGIVFDNKGNLYISNESGDHGNASILRFDVNKK